jgi:hypothetical protein
MWEKINGSIVPVVRGQLTSQGITGQGITVTVLEPANPPLPEGVQASSDTTLPTSGEQTNHSKTVMNLLNDPVFGIAPGTRVNFRDAGIINLSIFDDPPPEIRQNPMALRSFIQNNLKQGDVLSFRNASTHVNQIMQEGDAAKRVINMSYGKNAIDKAATLYKLMQSKPDWAMAILGEPVIDPQASAMVQQNPERLQDPTFLAELNQLNRTQEKKEKTLAFMTETMNSPEIKQAQQQWVNTTKQSADSGIVIVAAAGNAHMLAEEWRQQGVNVPPEAESNWFTHSDHIISVGGSHTNNTPHTVQDDLLYSESASGTSRFKPTISAQGDNVIFAPQDYQKLSNLQSIPPQALSLLPKILASPAGGELLQAQGDGTSFSAPYVSGTVAMMLQQNPNLTFAEIKQKLQAAATDTPADNTREGAGILDVVKAVQSAAPGGVSAGPANRVDTLRSGFMEGMSKFQMMLTSGLFIIPEITKIYDNLNRFLFSTLPGLSAEGSLPGTQPPVAPPLPLIPGNGIR